MECDFHVTWCYGSISLLWGLGNVRTEMYMMIKMSDNHSFEFIHLKLI